MLPSLGIAIFCKEVPSIIGFSSTIAILSFLSLILMKIGEKSHEFHTKEGLAIVSMGWVILSLFGALPYYISGAIPRYIDCFFETVSGFTTTGSTILIDIETLPYSILYWRSFTHWLGGMGILVFMLAIVPMSKNTGSSVYILRAESPGPSVGKLMPRTHQTAKILYGIYMLLTVIEILLLFLGGMPLFDSIVNSFSTAGTGGFATKNASIGFYNSAYVEYVITIFMILFGINFNIFYLLFIKDFKNIKKDEELRVYLGIILVAVILITCNITPLYPSISDAFRHAVFQVSSIITTTGFATADFNIWPQTSRFIMILLMVLGASAGSTGGGIKTIRALLLWRYFKRGMLKLIHPNAVSMIKVNGKIVDQSVIEGIFGYFVAYFIVIVISILLISLEPFDLETIVSSVITCINNTGPGLSIVGPVGNFAAFTDMSKLVLTFNMIIGRLEIFPVLVILMPSTWKKN